MFWIVLLYIVAGLFAVFLLLGAVALLSKPASVYAHDPAEQNPMEGKKVVFTEEETDPLNADGKRGHLEEIGVSQRKRRFYESFVKRLLDLLISFLILVFLSPLFLVLILAIKADDPGPAFFVQKRVGKNKRYFKLHKFRSMRTDTPRDKPTHMLENPDRYITKVGKFLRSHSLDELPQIWDIFLGNMSFVGPRPALWNQEYLIAERDKVGANDVLPGMTGPAQINGRDALCLEKKAKLDGEYAANLSFLLDLKCFFATARVLTGDSSIVEGAGKGDPSEDGGSAEASDKTENAEKIASLR